MWISHVGFSISNEFLVAIPFNSTCPERFDDSISPIIWCRIAAASSVLTLSPYFNRESGRMANTLALEGPNQFAASDRQESHLLTVYRYSFDTILVSFT